MTTDENLRRALLVETQIELYRRQARWEPWKAIAMILLAAAAISAAGGLAGQLWPARTQQITVHVVSPK